MPELQPWWADFVPDRPCRVTLWDPILSVPLDLTPPAPVQPRYWSLQKPHTLNITKTHEAHDPSASTVSMENEHLVNTIKSHKWFTHPPLWHCPPQTQRPRRQCCRQYCHLNHCHCSDLQDQHKPTTGTLHSRAPITAVHWRQTWWNYVSQLHKCMKLHKKQSRKCKRKA